jgi:hypothetical protein
MSVILTLHIQEPLVALWSTMTFESHYIQLEFECTWHLLDILLG